MFCIAMAKTIDVGVGGSLIDLEISFGIFICCRTVFGDHSKDAFCQPRSSRVSTNYRLKLQSFLAIKAHSYSFNCSSVHYMVGYGKNIKSTVQEDTSWLSILRLLALKTSTEIFLF